MKKLMAKKLLIINYSLLIIILASCSITKQISKQANATILKDSAVNTGHIGISIYDPAANKYLYNHNAAQYFIPASNVKLFTLYAGMKYLADSLVGLRYQYKGDSIVIEATGDPTFLHADFANQPVFNFLKKQKKIYLAESFVSKDFLGEGWAWDDFKEGYMVQRNSFPMYGNVIKAKWINKDSINVSPSFFQVKSGVLEPLKSGFEVIKDFEENQFVFINGFEKTKTIPFRPDIATLQSLLEDTLKIKIGNDWWVNDEIGEQKIYSQPSDSLFKIMMHRSDNFFAEQTLIMASKRGWRNLADKNETLVLIDTVLKLHLPKLSQRPKWVDGSGLSRYNLFTPQSFVQILNQLKLEFGLPRLQTILPTGGEGTLSSYFKKYTGHVFAKTGTLSNNCALSGYLITKKGKLLIFSILNNNYITGATPVRKAVETFLGEIIERY